MLKNTRRVFIFIIVGFVLVVSAINGFVYFYYVQYFNEFLEEAKIEKLDYFDLINDDVDPYYEIPPVLFFVHIQSKELYSVLKNGWFSDLPKNCKIVSYSDKIKHVDHYIPKSDSPSEKQKHLFENKLCIGFNETDYGYLFKLDDDSYINFRSFFYKLHQYTEKEQTIDLFGFGSSKIIYANFVLSRKAFKGICKTKMEIVNKHSDVIISHWVQNALNKTGKYRSKFNIPFNMKGFFIDRFYGNLIAPDSKGMMSDKWKEFGTDSIVFHRVKYFEQEYLYKNERGLIKIPKIIHVPESGLNNAISIVKMLNISNDLMEGNVNKEGFLSWTGFLVKEYTIDYILLCIKDLKVKTKELFGSVSVVKNEQMTRCVKENIDLYSPGVLYDYLNFLPPDFYPFFEIFRFGGVFFSDLEDLNLFDIEKVINATRILGKNTFFYFSTPENEDLSSTINEIPTKKLRIFGSTKKSNSIFMILKDLHYFNEKNIPDEEIFKFYYENEEFYFGFKKQVLYLDDEMMKKYFSRKLEQKE